MELFPQALMALGFFGMIAVTVRSAASVWIKRMESSRLGPSADAIEARLARIEQAVDVIAIEVERMAETQRYTLRVNAEREAGRIAGPVAPTIRPADGRSITPH